MANKDAAFGLRPVRYANGSPYNGQVVKAYAADTSNALYVGDPVVRTGSGDANGIPAVQRAAANGAVWGIVQGILGDSNDDLTRDTQRYVTANTNAYLAIAPAEDMIFEAQEDSGGGDLAVTDIGRTVNVVFGTPSTSHPIVSAAELDSSTAATTSASMNFIVYGLVQNEDNEIGANARWEVKVNNFDNAEV